MKLKQEFLPETWDLKKIKDVSNITGGSTPSTNESKYWSGDIPWATPTDLTKLNGNKIKDTESKITKEGLNSTSTHILPENSLLLTTRATIGKCAVNKVPMATNQGFQNLVPNGNIDVWYLFYQISRMAPYLESLGAGSTFTEISKSILKNIKIPVPPKPEQRKIASILYNVDQAIQKTEEIIEQTKRVKKGLMQDLFTEGTKNHSEFKEIFLGAIRLEVPKEWSKVNLETMTNLITKGKTPTSYGFNYQDEGVNFLKVESIDEDGTLVEEKVASICEENHEEFSSSKLEEGDLLFSIAGGLGRSTIVKNEILPANINQALALIRFEDDVDKKYVRYFLDTFIFEKYFRSISTHTAQTNLSLKQVSNFPVLLPSEDEQREIAEKLSSVDQKLKNEQEVLKKYEIIKIGLMQDLLTGAIRTDDKNIEVLDEVIEQG